MSVVPHSTRIDEAHAHPSGTHCLVHMYLIEWEEPEGPRCHLTTDTEMADRNARAGADVSVVSTSVEVETVDA